jgi:hypothetical protein
LLSKTVEGVLNLKDLLTVLPTSHRATFSGSDGPRKGSMAYLLILQRLMPDLVRETSEVLLNLKGFTNCDYHELSGELFEFGRATEAWRSMSVDSAEVNGRCVEEDERRLAESKGLIYCVSAEP